MPESAKGSKGNIQYGHRGRIQAQGDGTQESVAWNQDTPPTESEMLEMCDLLESKLTPRELRDRAKPMDSLRHYLRAVSASGGLDASKGAFNKAVAWN